MPGARGEIKHLRGRHHRGVVTSGDRDRVVRQLRLFQLTDLFASHVCSGDTRYRKPHPAPLRLALRQMSLDPAACVYVGDSPEDLEIARRAGVRALAVLRPFPTQPRLPPAQTDILLTSSTDIPAA